MKDQQNAQQKVSLIFYSEEEGKRTMIDKWAIEIGKKYTIGRSKKKVDITIQDINISRVQAELIFYDKDKIMIKDLDSSNGTYINKERIEPHKERYCSVRDNISIGDDKNEIIFELPEELKIIKKEKRSRFVFDDKKENKKIENYNYFKNEENNKEINFKKNISESYFKDSFYERNFFKKDKYDRNDKYFKKEEEEFDKEEKYEKTDKYNNYDKKDMYVKFDKYDKYDKRDRYDKYDKYDKIDKYEKIDKYKNKFKKDSRSRSRKYSYNKNESNSKYRKFSSTSSEKYDNLWKKSPKYSKEKQTKNNEEKEEEINKKSKYKNISSYIIKKDTAQEEEIERENNQRQIELYNEYLECKKEWEENIKIANLPSLLPVLVPQQKESDSDSDSKNDDDNEEEEENEKKIDIFGRRIFNPYFLSKRKSKINSINNYVKPFLGMKKKRGVISSFRNLIIKRNYY